MSLSYFLLIIINQSDHMHTSLNASHNNIILIFWNKLLLNCY